MTQVPTSLQYWKPASRENNFVVRTPDPGAIDTFKMAGGDALYHSPVSGLIRWFELTSAKNDLMGDAGRWLAPDEAQERFGLDGALQFDEPITEKAAMIMYERKKAEINREFVLSTGNNSAGRMTGSFLTGMAATIVDPINLASMFVPVVGEARFAQMVARSGGQLWKARMARGFIEGGVGASMVEPLVLLPALQEQSNYGYLDTALNLGFGAIIGSGLHVGLGKVSDIMKRGRVSPDTKDKMFRAAMSDVLNDRAVTSPREIVGFDPKSVREHATFDARLAREESIRELGFQTDEPDTFRIYPDKSISDPKPNEPWFHGRVSDVSVIKDQPTYFTRDPDLANQFAAGDVSGRFEETQIIVANLELKNPATKVHVKQILESMNIDPNNPELHIANPEVMNQLKLNGFDSYLGREATGEDVAVVFSSDQIKTPGRRQVKTGEGIKFADAREQRLTLEKRTKDLEQSSIKNLVERKRRSFQQEQGRPERENAPPREVDDTHTFLREDLEKERTVLERDVDDSVEGSLDKFVDDMSPIERELYDDVVGRFDDLDAREKAYREGLDCILRNING